MTHRHLERMARKESRHAVPSVHIRATVSIEVKPAEQQDALLGYRSWRPRIDDERAVQPASEVLRAGDEITVIRIQASGPRLQDVGARLARRNRLPAILRGRVGTVRVQVMGMRREIA